MKATMCRMATKAAMLATLLATFCAWPGAAATTDVPHVIMPDNTQGTGWIIRRTYTNGLYVTNTAGTVQKLVKGNAGGNGLCISPDGQWLVVPGNATWDGNYVVQFWQKYTNAFGWTIGHGYKELNIPGGTYSATNPWIRANFTFAACSPDSQYAWLVDQTNKNLVRLTLTNDYAYDWNDALRGTTQAKGLPDIVVSDLVHLVEPRQIAFGQGNGHAYQDMYIANGSGTNVVVYDGISGAFIKAINLPSGMGVTNWVGAVLADAKYLYVLTTRKPLSLYQGRLLKYDFNASAYTTPLINGNTNEFADVWYMQWSPGGKIVYSATTPTWSYTVNEFDPKTSQFRRYFASSGVAEHETFAFYVPPAVRQGTTVLFR